MPLSKVQTGHVTNMLLAIKTLKASYTWSPYWKIPFFSFLVWMFHMYTHNKNNQLAWLQQFTVVKFNQLAMMIYPSVIVS